MFLIDIINTNSLILIENLLKIINEEKDNFPYLTKIMIQNKKNLEKNKHIKNSEIDNYLSNIKILVDQEISYDYNNINELLNIIFDNINYNVNNYILPTNTTSEDSINKLNSNKIIPLNFILLGERNMGKSPFFNRYFKYIYKEDYLILD